MTNSLHGHWALVLGVSSGMGRAAARDLAREGVNILGVHFDTASGQEKAAVNAEELRSLGVEVRFFNENAARADVRARLVTEFAEVTSVSGTRLRMTSLAIGACVRSHATCLH